jgi:hypothetical protein
MREKTPDPGVFSFAAGTAVRAAVMALAAAVVAGGVRETRGGK